MKLNRIALIFSIVLISLLAVSAASAADNASDVIEVADDSDAITVETQIDEDTEILTEEITEEIVASPAEDIPLSDDASGEVSEITIYSEGQKVMSFNYTKANGTYDFKEILDMLNQSGMNMSNFGNFADMFDNFNFTGQNKTFDFNIAGDVNEVQYNLKIVSNPKNFVFDYIIKSPNMGGDFNNITSTNLSIYENGNFLTNITFNANAMGLDEMMSMFNMTGYENMTLQDMMKMFNFTDMASQFGNSSMMEDSNKTFDFKIDGEVGNVKYDMIVKSNETAFVFDYKIHYAQLLVTLDIEGTQFTTVNTAVDGKNGKYMTITLKDQFGRAINNRTIYVVLNNDGYSLTTDSDGKAQLQVNIASAGTYLASVAFLGDNTYESLYDVAKITVSKQTPKLTTSKKTYKAKAKTKKLTATFKSSKGKAIKNKKITFKVKGKTYTATTNNKGVATVNVKLTKKGTYSFTAKFAGDSTYKAVSKSSKLVLK